MRHPSLFGKINLLFVALLTSSCPKRIDYKEVGGFFFSTANKIEFTIEYFSSNENSFSLKIYAYYTVARKKPLRFYIVYNDSFDYLKLGETILYKDYYGDFFGPIDFNDYLEIIVNLSNDGKTIFQNKCYARVSYSMFSFPSGRYFLYVEI